MKRVHVIAGAGFVGEALADCFARAGEAVVALTRSPASAASLGAEKQYAVIACDVGDHASVAALRDELPSADEIRIVHCASSGRGGPDAYRRVFVAGARHLIDALQPRRFVFTSSTSVYGQTDGSDVTEGSPAEPARETGRLLLEAESIARAAGGSVARLAGIYGPGRSVLLSRFLEGAAVIDDLEDAPGGRIINQIHRDDAASALAVILDRGEPGAIYNVADDSPIAQADLYAALAERFARPLPPRRPPDLNRKRGFTSKRILNGRLRALGWSPRHPSFLEALDRDPDLVRSGKS